MVTGCHGSISICLPLVLGVSLDARMILNQRATVRESGMRVLPACNVQIGMRIVS